MIIKRMRRHSDTVIPQYIKRKGVDDTIPEIDPKTYDPVRFYGYDNTELTEELDYFIKTYGIKNPESWEFMADTLTESAKEGDREAAYHLIRLNYFLFDERRYISLMKKEAEDGLLAAQMDCARYYSSRGDRENMNYWILRAAENGDIEAKVYVADRIYDDYRRGLNDGKDAVRFYETAAYEGRNVNAISRLVKFYSQGVIVEKDLDKARMFEKMLDE